MAALLRISTTQTADQFDWARCTCSYACWVLLWFHPLSIKITSCTQHIEHTLNTVHFDHRLPFETEPTAHCFPRFFCVPKPTCPYQYTFELCPSLCCVQWWKPLLSTGNKQKRKLTLENTHTPLVEALISMSYVYRLMGWCLTVTVLKRHGLVFRLVTDQTTVRTRPAGTQWRPRGTRELRSNFECLPAVNAGRWGGMFAFWQAWCLWFKSLYLIEGCLI